MTEGVAGSLSPSHIPTYKAVQEYSKDAQGDNDRNGRGWDARCKECTEEGTKGGGDLEEHADAHVGKTLLDIGSRSPRGGSNHRDERGADGIADVYFEGQR